MISYIIRNMSEMLVAIRQDYPLFHIFGGLVLVGLGTSMPAPRTGVVPE